MVNALSKKSKKEALVERTRNEVESFKLDSTDQEELKTHIVRLQSEPESITGEQFSTLFRALVDNPKYLRVLALRLFDTNADTVLNRSESNAGVIGYLNRKSTNRRRKKYFKKINRGFRSLSHVSRLTGRKPKVILAEGDSWFEYPYVVTDIVDWLRKRDDYAVYCSAAAGDWLSNMIYSGEYVDQLPIHEPDVFLVSGGGNDLVGENRLSLMIHDTRSSHQGTALEWFGPAEIDDEEIQHGRKYVKREFMTFLNILKLQYSVLFSNVREKYENLRIITHGYDYAIPTKRINWSFSPQPFVNLFSDHGKWLRQSFMLRGIVEPSDQKAIVKAMIHEYNEMMISIIESGLFENIHHIDLRGVVGPYGWYDEMHPNSRAFRKISRAFEHCIDEEQPPTGSHKHDGIPVYSC